MKVEFEHFRALVALGEHRNFTRAAQSLNLSQPALSRRIQALEISVGHPLINRAEASTSLTACGLVVLARAISVLRCADELTLEIDDLFGGVTDHARIGLTTHALGAPTTQVLQAYRAIDPKFRLIEIGNDEVLTRLEEGDLDLVLGLPSNIVNNTQATLMGSEPKAIMLSADHPLARSTELSTRDLLNESFVVFPWMRNADLGRNCPAGALKVSASVETFAEVTQLVAMGIGLHVVPSSFALRHQHHEVCYVPAPELPWSLIGITTPSKPTVRAREFQALTLRLGTTSAMSFAHHSDAK